MSFSSAHARALQFILLDAQVLSALALFGLIWFVQLVHYPLFGRIPTPVFAAYEAEHANRTGWLAAPLMIAELLSSGLLLNQHLRPSAISAGGAMLGAVLAGLTWVSTFTLQVPLHNRLHRGADPVAIRQLVATNWLRTMLWTAKAVLILSWINQLAK